jgi:hypothetical protein
MKVGDAGHTLLGIIASETLCMGIPHSSIPLFNERFIESWVEPKDRFMLKPVRPVLNILTLEGYLVEEKEMWKITPKGFQALWRA